MNLREPRAEEPLELNLVSLVDIVFTMLLFFVLTTTFDRRADIALELPEAESAEVSERRDHIEITIDPDGRFYVQGQALVESSLDSLRRALGEAVEGGAPSEAPRVVITADGTSPHQAVVTAMDATRQLGINRVTIATSLQQGTPADGPTP